MRTKVHNKAGHINAKAPKILPDSKAILFPDESPDLFKEMGEKGIRLKRGQDYMIVWLEGKCLFVGSWLLQKDL